MSRDPITGEEFCPCLNCYEDCYECCGCLDDPNDPCICVLDGQIHTAGPWTRAGGAA